jgi:hypothetical protein
LVVGFGLLIVCYGKGMVEPNLLEFVGVTWFAIGFEATN